jgi:hypothetical protein
VRRFNGKSNFKTNSNNVPDIPEMKLPTLKELGLEFSEIDSRAAIQFKGGETAAMQRLNHYFFETKIFRL